MNKKYNIYMSSEIIDRRQSILRGGRREDRIYLSLCTYFHDRHYPHATVIRTIISQLP